MKVVERWLRKEIRAALDSAVDCGAIRGHDDLYAHLVGWLISAAQVPRAELDAVIERIKAARAEEA